MRPLYEDQASLQGEKDVLALLESRWGCVGFKLPLAYRLDYALTVDGVIKAWAEVKCRGKPYSEMYLSLHKFMAGSELSKVTGLPFVLVYGFKAGVFWRAVQDDRPGLVIGGRSDRGDWQDTEPMAVFSLQSFKEL